MKQIALFKFDEVVGYALVDDCDFNALSVFVWHTNTEGYACAKIEGDWHLMHRMILGFTKRDGKQTDHIDRNRLNNCRANLREATALLNSQNKKHRGGSSPYRGVVWNKSLSKWQAQVGLNRKLHYLGLFSDEKRAAAVAAAFRDAHMPFANKGEFA